MTPGTYIVWCRVSGGVTGMREGPLREGGDPILFETMEQAEDRARTLNLAHAKRAANGEASADLRYWARAI